jgi:hypothetical protein
MLSLQLTSFDLIGPRPGTTGHYSMTRSAPLRMSVARSRHLCARRRRSKCHKPTSRLRIEIERPPTEAAYPQALRVGWRGPALDAPDVSHAYQFAAKQ